MITVAVSIPVYITEFDRRWRTVSKIAIGNPVAMVHRPDEYLLPAPLALAPRSAASVLTVSRIVLLRKAALVRRFLLVRWRRLGVDLDAWLTVSCWGRLSLGCVGAGLAFPPPSPSAVSLGRPLRSLLLLRLRRCRLGLFLFYCHACTSWCVAIIAAFIRRERCWGSVKLPENS